MKEEKLPVQERSYGKSSVQAESRGVPLDLATAGDLLREHGYELLCRFGHMHARIGEQEWHVCLVKDLATMTPLGLQSCLEDAIALSLQIERIR